MSIKSAVPKRPPLLEHLSGSVERVTFHSEENGFCVLRVKVQGQRDLVTVVGTAATVSPGEFLQCEGGWVNDVTYGLQFRTQKLRVVPPNTLEGIEKYLGSGMIKGIGPHFARHLVEAFGEQVFDIIEHYPDRLMELEGIGPKRKARVVEAWVEQKVVRDIMVFLQSHGVGTARAVRIYKTYGDQAIDSVRENPYRLALDIHGIGFVTADTIAQRLGISKESLLRARAGIRHVLQEMTAEGHCAADREHLVKTGARLLEIEPARIEEAIDLEIKSEGMVLEMVEGRPSLFLTPLYRAEVGVTNHLMRLMKGAPPWGVIDPGKALPWVEKKTGLRFSASQREAMQKALSGKVTVITGGPGVGKTTIVNALLRIIGTRAHKILSCAPTGRAAKRLSETTGTEAKTIHRMLEFDPKHFGFKRHSDHPLEADLIIVDEASMVDVVLMNQLLRAIPSRAGLVLVGDVDQLPSVGPGAVLGDIIGSGRIPTVRLTEIFRQAARSSIVVNAHRINAGRVPEPNDGGGLCDFYFIAADEPEEIYDKLFQLVLERIPKRFGLDPIRDIQVLTPMNRGSLGARSLNVELQQRLNANATPSVSRYGWNYAKGDKVIQLVNNYHKEVYNGDIGQIRLVDPEQGSLHVLFDDRQVSYEFAELDELSLAYATSVHKSQGSEYPAVVIPLATQHYLLLERNLLYTAVTRGRKLVVVVGQPKALGLAVRTIRSTRRLTQLAERLRRFDGEEN